MHNPRSQGMRRTPKHCPFQIGTRIRPTGMFEHHQYEQGRTYFVVDIDEDDYTLRARDEAGNIGTWIRWVNCAIIRGIDWRWLRDQLPPDALALLLAFDGLERLKLREDVVTTLVSEVPSLRKGILACAAKLKPTPPLP